MSGYTEDHLIEQPAIQLMEHELGWDSVNAYEPPSSRAAGLRRSSGLINCLDAAVEELTRDRSALSLAEADREIDKLLRGGAKVKMPDRERGGQRAEEVRTSCRTGFPEGRVNRRFSWCFSRMRGFGVC